MALQPKFQNDLFISYRRAANQSPDRWVDEFERALKVKLSELMVGDPKFWRDTESIPLGDIWKQATAKNIDDAAVFLAVVSRSYFGADECRYEFDYFLGRLKDPQTGSMRKIFPVLKQPPDPDIEPPVEWGSFNHVQFYEPLPNSDQFREIGPSGDERDKRLFWEKLSQLAQFLEAGLKGLRKAESTQRRALGQVFLASVGPELKSERDRLRADLHQRGFEVEPQNDYLWNTEGCLGSMTNHLESSMLAIHLVTRTASIDPATHAHARLQLETAQHVMKSRGRPPPLVWIPPAPEIHPSMRDLIHFVHHDLADSGVSYWEGGADEFKNQIYDRLPRRSTALDFRRPAADATNRPRDIALLFEQSEMATMRPMKERLTRALGCEAFKIELSQGKPVNEQSMASRLARCEAAIVFWGEQDEDWLVDVLTSRALEPYAMSRRLAVYLAPPDSDEKSCYFSPRARRIHPMPNPDRQDDTLDSFLDTLSSAAP